MVSTKNDRVFIGKNNEYQESDGHVRTTDHLLLLLYTVLYLPEANESVARPLLRRDPNGLRRDRRRLRRQCYRWRRCRHRYHRSRRPWRGRLRQ